MTTKATELSANTAATTDKALDAAAEEQKRNEADAQFREDVRKAGEKRDKSLAKLSHAPGRGANIAEIAWNETKADEDPTYGNCDGSHKDKLNAAVVAIRETGNADIVGLEAFEERVKELVADEKEVAGTPSKVAAAAKANLEKGKE